MAQIHAEKTEITRQKDKKYFGTDGIRGVANQWPMTPEIAMRAGLAAGKILTRGGHRHRVVIGKDTRLSGYLIEQALAAGLLATGMDVFQLGPLPTPAVAMLTRSLRADLGVMISASHNQYQDNGIKFFAHDGYKLSDRQENNIEKLMEDNQSVIRAKPDQIGRAKRIEDAQARYIEFVKRTFPKELKLEGMRIVIDCANGAAYKVAPTALWELGAEVITIGDKPDGFNINRKCGSTAPQRMCDKVKEMRADIGIALDGDADRIIIADEKGTLIDGDQIIALIASMWKKQDKLKGEGIISTIMANLGLEKFLAQHNLKLIRTNVGDRHIMNHMRKYKANVGGEPSGHIILADFSTTGDGLIASLQILAMLIESGKKTSQLCAVFDPIPQYLRNIRYQNPNPNGENNRLKSEKITKIIANAEEKLGKNGRFIIRHSGTEPIIRLMGEGENKDNVVTVIDEIAEKIEKILPKNDP